MRPKRSIEKASKTTYQQNEFTFSSLDDIVHETCVLSRFLVLFEVEIHTDTEFLTVFSATGRAERISDLLGSPCQRRYM